MKRFYTDVDVVAGNGGHAIMLDGRAVRTPKRAALALPTRGLADAVAGEWAAQETDILPGTMPLTGLANAAIDVIGPDADTMRAALGDYAETDALAYRGEDSQLLARQASPRRRLLLHSAATGPSATQRHGRCVLRRTDLTTIDWGEPSRSLVSSRH